MIATALMLDPASLRPNPWNTNIVAPENEAKLDASIERLGMFKPVIVREIHDFEAGATVYEILGGEHRAQSAVRLGLGTIPVVNLGAIGDKVAKEIGLVDNARYGADETLGLASLLKELGTEADLAGFLPYTDDDIKSIFSASDIALDDLALDEEMPSEASESDEADATRAPKTHTLMRFKVSLADAERITSLLSAIQKKHGYTLADALTNAGDALVHALLDKSTLIVPEDTTDAV